MHEDELTRTFLVTGKMPSRQTLSNGTEELSAPFLPAKHFVG